VTKILLLDQNRNRK